MKKAEDAANQPASFSGILQRPSLLKAEGLKKRCNPLHFWVSVVFPASQAAYASIAADALAELYP